ncbi:MAG: ABC transporter permease, partial [Rhizobium pusense]|nr:ABC transporter permease [Agrobacterium pusense]
MAIDATNATTVSPRRAGYRFNLTGWISLVIILAWALIAILAPYVTPHGISDIVDTDYFGPMSLQFPLGTDYLGRDMLSRILFGARYTVGISLAATLIACTIGVTLGMAAAVTGGWFDAALSRFVDALSSIPSKLFALVAVAGVGSSIPVLMLILGIIYTPGSYRFARALAVNVNTTDFVTVARIRGEKLSYLIRAEILPNIIGPVLADVGLRFVFI